MDAAKDAANVGWCYASEVATPRVEYLSQTVSHIYRSSRSGGGGEEGSSSPQGAAAANRNRAPSCSLGAAPASSSWPGSSEYGDMAPMPEESSTEADGCLGSLPTLAAEGSGSEAIEPGGSSREALKGALKGASSPLASGGLVPTRLGPGSSGLERRVSHPLVPRLQLLPSAEKAPSSTIAPRTQAPCDLSATLVSREKAYREGREARR